MAGVTTQSVSGEESGIRVDRWFKRHFPQLAHGRLEKLLRTGQIRIDGGRAKAGDRLAEGQVIRIPPLGAETEAPPGSENALRAKAPRAPNAADKAFLESLIISAGKDALVLNKPPGLAVQGGTNTHRHLDGLLDALMDKHNERPRLVHRLDRDTSGVLVLARSAAAAERLARAFRGREAEKIYWAVTAGVPEPHAGTIDLSLAKRGSYERVVPVDDEEEDGKHAVTDYIVLSHAGRRAALVAMRPLTGRTHQLRAHMAAIGTPILGDRKYGGADARIEGLNRHDLHLHARAIRMKNLEAAAPLPRHMVETCAFLGLDGDLKDDPFAVFAAAPRHRR